MVIDPLFPFVFSSCAPDPTVCPALTSLQIEQENTQLINDLYRLLKKYAGLRNIIRNLKVKPFLLILAWNMAGL